LIQYLFGREASLGDFVANGIGAIVGAVIARQLGLWLCWSGEINNVNN
jgi:VanZ family protein